MLKVPGFIARNYDATKVLSLFDHNFKLRHHKMERYVARANRIEMRAGHRVSKVRRTMSRIKLVLSERAIEDAEDDEPAR